MKQEEGSPASRIAGSQVVQRVALLMRLVAAAQRTGLRLTDLYRAAQLERPTAHRLLQALVTERLLRQDKENRRYFLGQAVYEMGLAASPEVALRDICHPHLQRIAQLTGDTVFLTERAGLDGVCTDRAEGNAPIKAYVLEVGKHRPLTVGGGATAILSALEDVEIDRICRANLDRSLKRYPRYSEAVLRRDIARARACGYVCSKVLELPEVRTVAVPIRGLDAAPVAAISVSTVMTRMTDKRTQEVAAILRQAVDEIEAELTERGPAARAQPQSAGGGRQPKNWGR